MPDLPEGGHNSPQCLHNLSGDFFFRTFQIGDHPSEVTAIFA